MQEGPLQIAGDGQPVFAALVKPLKNGGVKVCVALDDSDNGSMVVVDFVCEKGIMLATRLEREVGVSGGKG
jgi:hypothetical protein